MIDLLPGKLQFNENVKLFFPAILCCNCGTRTGLQLVEQESSCTAYFPLIGPEITFRLPLPFCNGCIPSSKRQPKYFFNRLLGFLMSFCSAALVLVVAGNFIFDIQAMAKYLIPFAMLVAITTTAIWIAADRPKRNQTSYFQPVRVTTLKKEFESGEVNAVRFSFTNNEYADFFALANQDAIERRVICIEKV